MILKLESTPVFRSKKTTMNIRPYNSFDLENAVSVFRSNIPKYFGPEEEAGLRGYLEEHPNDYFVAEVDGEVVGSGGFALNDDQTVSLCWGMIRKEHLGTGLGKKLTQYRIDAAREKHGDRPIVIST
jgi:ribosomal protein S18 acetylase RimI-like enzyme